MSLKQDWHRERKFLNYGTLKGISTRIKNISTCPSTTNAEAMLLRKVELYLNDVIESFTNENSATISLEKFQRIRGN